MRRSVFFGFPLGVLACFPQPSSVGPDDREKDPLPSRDSDAVAAAPASPDRDAPKPRESDADSDSAPRPSDSNDASDSESEVGCPSGVETELGTCAQGVFVTPTVHSGDLGGLEGADAICQGHARDNGLPGVWNAWLASSDADIGGRIEASTLPYALVTGTIVAENWDGLTSGELLHPIDVDAAGQRPTRGDSACTGSDIPVWTGAHEDGTRWSSRPYDFCHGWRATDAPATRVGDATVTVYWSSRCAGGCQDDAALFCIQQPANEPSPS